MMSAVYKCNNKYTKRPNCWSNTQLIHCVEI